MANFTTEFPIDQTNTISGVISLACEWITGSPHTKIQKSDLQDIPVNSERTVTVGDEQVSLAQGSSKEFDIGGIRYVRTEKGLQWTTSIVTLKTPDKHLLSLQVVCEAMNTATRLPPPKKPYFIRQALSRLGGGLDGEIPVTDKPFRLAENEAKIASALILGIAQNTLPIVYISAGFRDEHLVNPDDLAKLVSGMAHVVVEPSRLFSFTIKDLTKAKNVFGGAIGVYWPNSSARSTYFIDDETPSSRALQLEVAKGVRIALSNRRQVTLCTWLNLKEIVARNRFEQLKSVGSTELQEYIDVFDAEIAAKQARVSECEEEIRRLTTELHKLSAITQSSASGLLQRGTEQDLYQHEILDIVIDALADASRTARESSRRQHVLQDLLKVNVSSDARQALANNIKMLLKTYQGMDTKTRTILARLGFDISDDGKHYKAVFQGDRRYSFSLSKTGSDHRAGKNLASDINNMLF